MKHIFEYKDFLINEGGNVFTDTVSVKREDISTIISDFNSRVIQGTLRIEPAELIGSWKQKPISGDIDCLVYTDLTLPQIVQALTGAGIAAKALYGFNIVSTRFELANGEAVQIDIFVRPIETNREATDIFYKNIEGDPNTTKHRVFFLFTLLDNLREQVDGSAQAPISYVGYMLRPDGLYRIQKTLKKKNYAITDRTLIGNDAYSISKVIFGKPLPFSEWDTFEKSFNLFKKSKVYSDKAKIVSEYISKLEEEGLSLPTGVDLEA